jgi:cell wall-associated NlpC family hydrolase
VNGPATQRVRVRDPSGRRVLARFTPGARSVCLSGPQRSFDEFDAGAPVSHGLWVRLLPRPFDGDVDALWLQRALAANERGSPDLLAIAMQYLRNAPTRHRKGLRIAGDARYGPLLDTTTREEGSDFNDYLGVDWPYDDGSIDAAEARQHGCLDCSGYMRMVFGYRQHAPGAAHLPLGPTDSPPPAGGLPRRAHEMFTQGPGVVLIDRDTQPPSDLGALRPGDLLFFDTEGSDRLDHVALLLGRDAEGDKRFVSSRKSANGPTLGDDHGRSVLDGQGLYARALRAARRV